MKRRVDRETLKDILFALATAMCIHGAEGIIADYLAGKCVLARIGTRGRWHFDFMLGTLGYKPPVPEKNGRSKGEYDALVTTANGALTPEPSHACSYCGDPDCCWGCVT